MSEKSGPSRTMRSHRNDQAFLDTMKNCSVLVQTPFTNAPKISATGFKDMHRRRSMAPRLRKG